MQTQTFTQKNALNTLGLFGLLMLLSLAFNPIVAQNGERTVSGIISDEGGPLISATVVLKGTAVGIDTDENGTFTFPQKLKEGDVLVITHLGFEQQEVIIKADTSYLNITLNAIEMVIVGALMVGDEDDSDDKNDN